MEVDRKKSRWTLMEFMWKQLEVCDTCRRRWKYVEVYGSSWKIPRNHSWKLQLMETMEASISTHSGRFPFFLWKLPCISMEASTNFNGSKSTSTNLFHGNFYGSKSTSTDFHRRFHGSPFASEEVRFLSYKWKLPYP